MKWMPALPAGRDYSRFHEAHYFWCNGAYWQAPGWASDCRRAEVTAYTRNPRKRVIKHPSSTSNLPTFGISNGIEVILAAMQKCVVRWLVITVGTGVSDPNDQPALYNRLITYLLLRISR